MNSLLRWLCLPSNPARRRDRRPPRLRLEELESRLTPNSAPVLESIWMPTTVAEGEGPYGVFTATDADGDTLTYSTTGLPPGMTLQGTTTSGVGNLLGFSGYGALSGGSATYNPTLTIDDGHGGVITHTFTMTLTDVNRLAAPGAQGSAEGDTVYVPMADYNYYWGGPYTYAAAGLPDGLSIDPNSGVISGIVGYTNAASGASASFSVVVTLTDPDGVNDTRSLAWGVSDTALLADLDDQSSAEGDTVSLPTALATPNGVTFAAPGLPDGLSIDSWSGVISGVVNYGNATAEEPGSFTVLITASYGGSVIESRNVPWSVTDTNRLSAIADQSHIEGWEVELQVEATDLAGNSLTYSAVDLPGGLSIDTTTGLITGELDGPDSLDPVTVTVRVTGGGGTDEMSFSWEVKPLVSADPLDDRVSIVGDSVGIQPVATIGGSLALTFSATGLPAGVTIDSSTGEISGTIDAEAAGSYSVEVSADCDGYGATISFTWTVVTVEATLPTDADAGEECDITVGELTALEPGAVPADYVVTIDWGDGQTGSGSVTEVDGTYRVSGVHTYEAAGDYTPQVTITHFGNPIPQGNWNPKLILRVGPPVAPAPELTPADTLASDEALIRKCMRSRCQLTHSFVPGCLRGLSV